MIPPATHGVTGVVERLFREVHGQAIATLVRLFGDISLAEDAVQDAFAVVRSGGLVKGFRPLPRGGS